MKPTRMFLSSAVLLAAAALSAELAPFPQWSAARRITEGPREHLLASYFAIDSWSPDHRYMLVLETDLNGRLPEADERCTLGLVDLVDGNKFIPVATTACWNFQEAAMAHWIDGDTILFNDFRGGKFVAVVMNWRTKAERILPMPVSAVSEDRTWAVSVNYARLYLTRPDYGYAGEGQDPRKTVEWPEDDGLWTMDLKTGECKLILPVAQGRSQMPPTKRIEGKPGQPLAYYCHTVISKDGEKVFFLARSVDWYNEKTHEKSAWQTTSFTINRDGTGLRRCFKDGWSGSHFNWAPDGSHKLLMTATWNERNDPALAGKAWSTVEFEVGREDKVRRIGAGVLDLDWHCVYSPDGKFMSGETYWTKFNERPWVLVRLEDGMTMPMGAFYVPPEYRGTYWRCDLHARFRPDGRQIAFNSVHEGSRQVYVRDISPGRTEAPAARVAASGVGCVFAADAATPRGFVNVADFAAADGKTDASAAIQRLIDENPNRTMWFADGTYLLSKPICTPADPKRSVDLQLSNYAILKAAPGWTNAEAMIRLGGVHPANDIRTAGSVYSLTGGIIDGSGVAKGVSIESGRETRVRRVSMKNVSTGLHIKRGANNNSSDCDISDVNIVGNRKPGSIGVFIESCDNTLSNMRIADVQTGVRLAGNGNLMTNVHPLYTNPADQYSKGVGFHDLGRNNSYNRCYSDHFSTGFLFGRKNGGAVLDACIAFWYAPSKGCRHTAIRCEGRFTAHVSDMEIGFRGTEAVNTVLEAGKPGGNGYLRDLRMDDRLVNETAKAYLQYLK